MRTAVFPGSFDPLTLGHVDIVLRATQLFDHVIVAVGINTQKTNLFSLDERLTFIREAFKVHPNVSASSYEGLTVDFCRKMGASFILRGLRTHADFDYEKNLGDANKRLSGIETICLFSAAEHSFISSTIVRDIIKNGGDLQGFVPNFIAKNTH